MIMGLTFKTDIKPKYTEKQGQVLIARIGSTIIRLIRTRVQQDGQNVNEEQMQFVTPYSAGYAAFKGKRAAKVAGRQARSDIRSIERATGYKADAGSKKYNIAIAKNTAKNSALKVNMTLSGRMMQSLKVVKSSIQNGLASVTVGWTGAQYEKAAHNQERREFFGLSKNEVDEVSKIVNDTADEIARGVL